MAIEAPISRFRKNNLKIYIVVLIGIAIWCAYDGYLNKSWKKKHTDADGNPDTYLIFNRKAPPFFIGAAVLLGVYLFVIRNNKVVADENELTISAKEKIPYDAIQKIDRTHFGSKGFFHIIYEDKAGNEIKRKLSERGYDNLEAILDELIAKIS